MKTSSQWRSVESASSVERLVELAAGFEDTLTISSIWQGAEYIDSGGNAILDGSRGQNNQSHNGGLAMKQLLKFDEDSLVNRLRKLDPKTRTAFGYFAALRLLPSCRHYLEASSHTGFELVQALADRLWRDLSGLEAASTASLKEGAEALTALLPGPDDRNSDAIAEIAISSLIYVFRSRLRHDPQESAWAAKCAYEAMDQYAQNQSPLASSEPRYEDMLLEQEQVQSELFRQKRDLGDLEEWQRKGSPLSSLNELKSRSEVEAQSLS